MCVFNINLTYPVYTIAYKNIYTVRVMHTLISTDTVYMYQNKIMNSYFEGNFQNNLFSFGITVAVNHTTPLFS